MYNGLGVRFADFISYSLNIPWKWNNLVSLRPNYFIFIGYLKTGGGGGARANPLTPTPGSATARVYIIGPWNVSHRRAMKARQSLRCSHTQSMDADQDSNQAIWPITPLDTSLAHMRLVPKPRMQAIPGEYYIYSASIKSYQYQSFDISENI